MSKTLVIAEKPSVATDIAKALGGLKKVGDHYEGDEYIVASAVGHLLEIKAPDEYEVKRGKWSFEHLPVIPPHFDLSPIKKSETKLNSLLKLIKKRDVSCIINACDAGREGELIFRYIIEAAKSKKTLKRLWLQSMTKKSILDAFSRLRSNEEMLLLADAAKSRSEADWLVGINGTRAMTAFNSKDGGFFLTTVGRVQTPTLALVTKREADIQAFKAKTFWEIHAVFDVANGEYAGKWIDPKFKKSADKTLKAERIWNLQEAEKIVAACTGQLGTITEESKPSNTNCPALFDLTSLQREANAKFGLSAKTTLSLAQALYEKHKVLTYPRTDARALPEDYIPTVKQTLSMLAGCDAFGNLADAVLKNNWVKQDKKIFNNAKISDHFAIIPTTQPAPGTLSELERKIYDLVVRRFIAIFYPPAQFLNTTRKTVVQNHTFVTEGKVLTKPGWLAVYGKDATDKESLVPVAHGETAKTRSASPIEMQTKPPARYNEATLLGAMESAGKSVEEAELREAMAEKGIGTPATRAAIIEGLILQGYMVRDGRDLIPTYKAKQLMTLLAGLGINVLTEAELTGEWEYKLAQIEKGTVSRKEFMAEIASLTNEIVSKAKSYGASTVPIDNPVHLKSPCPKCGGEIVENYKRFACRSCDFSIAKHLAGRTFSPQEVEELISRKEIGPLTGFISKMGRPFNAILRLGGAPDFKVDFDFGNEQKEKEPVDLSTANIIGKCPVCQGNVLDTPNAYVCETNVNSEGKKCKFRIGKSILQQPIDVEQLKKLLETGKTDLLTGFVSNKTHRPFSAHLCMDKAGKISFEFAPKKAAAKKK